jgi:hypothetical protein
LNSYQVWFEDGFVFSKFIPSCFDPTYCETDPPEPSPPNVDYIEPELGSLKYGDGEIISYRCQNPRKKFKVKCKSLFYEGFLIQSYVFMVIQI